ncbi:recombinase family protein [Bacillus glycinifermentans]|uniref:recombinase family protein n=1 Tax=Bacillus glycinifermentans TaxID=1664069 RepID=UPI0022E208D3|nr:recombinase family protein [Bacillus glycinifermentans]
MIYGYARKSSEIQKPMLLKNIEELNQAGAEKVYCEIASESREEKQALNELIAGLKSGDEVYLLGFNHLSRNESEVKSILEEIKARGAETKVLTK